MGFVGAYFGVLMCLHWLVAGQQRYSRCVDHYKTGSRIDRHYDLEILPRIVVSVYCKDMNTGEPSEYISLTSSREENYASYDKLLGSPLACSPTVPQRNWDEWGKTHFTRIRFNFDSWLVTTNDFSYATSVEGGSDIPYGQGGDNQTTQTCPFRGDFNINLTSTPFEVHPQVTWSWEGPMSNNHSVSFSNLRQIVSGRCGGFPGICFPLLPSNRSIARLKLRLVSTHPCLTKNPCENLGKCLVRDAKAYDCSCLPGSRGSNCEEFLDGNRFNFCAQGKGLVCQNSGTCENIIKTAITAYGGDGSQETCKFPSTWLGEPVTQCVSNCLVGPPFACYVQTDGVSDYVGLGWWSPGIVYTFEGWFRPTKYAAGRKTIMGKINHCSKMGVALDNGKFALIYTPLTGCSNSSHTAKTRTIGHINQWHHVAMTVDGTNARLYVNGSLLKTVQTRAAYPLPPEGFSLGNEYCCSNNGFAGDIKSFTVWKRALKRTEIVEHYNKPVKDFNATHHVIYNRLASHYDFCTILQPDCRGTDHGNRDWSPADGDVVSGVHCNVRTFAIEANITVKVEPWTNNSANFGTLKVYAYDIIIRGTLTAKGAGYKGGEQSTKSNSSGKQGESFQSVGKTTSTANEGGGGGGPRYGKPGGGGGYGTAGQPGFSDGGEGGHSYGTVNLRILHLGSGGGSGSNYANASVSGEDSISDGRVSTSVLDSGRGGNGGGALLLDARNRIQVTGQVSANGGDGEDGYLDRNSQGSGAGGGGAGGSIYLRGLEINVNDGRVTAFGGRGGCGALGFGGDGGSGRIRIDFDKFTGKTEPSPANTKSYLKTFHDLATLARESISISQMSSSNDQSVYLGCHADAANKPYLSYHVPITKNETEFMTPEFCRQKCYAKNYEYYGVHSRNKCYCDNDYGEVLLDDSTCNLPCPGNGSLMCGGFQGTSTYGPIPRRPSVAQFSAHRTCKPWCPVGFSINSHQSLYGFCSNVKAFLWDFKCNCSAGWHGKLCELRCFKGKYGRNCEEDCECRNNSGCDPVSGTCDCFPGWAGPTCSPGKFGPDCNTPCKCVDRCTLDSCPRESVDFTIEMESEKLVINNSLNCLGNSSASNRTAVRAGNSSLNGATSTSTSLTVIHAFNVSAVDEYWLRLVVYVPGEKVFPASIFVEFTDRDRLLFYIPSFLIS
ncbi:uncharacterized protein [Oscarella lobularis]|uniref:uncharacterized protein n=1 Tax=Oscarella lobularis TaxID=121494 RepID=UPI003313D8D3